MRVKLIDWAVYLTQLQHCFRFQHMVINVANSELLAHQNFHALPTLTMWVLLRSQFSMRIARTYTVINIIPRTVVTNSSCCSTKQNV